MDKMTRGADSTLRPLATVAMLRLLAFIAVVFAGLCFWGTYAVHDVDGYATLGASEQAYVKLATTFMEGTRAEKDRLPTPREFSAWANEMDAKGFRFEGLGFTYAAAPFSDSQALNDCFGKAPEGAYSLSFWNGDEVVSHASWNPVKARACIDDSNYLFGKRRYAALLFAVVGVVLLLFAGWLQLYSERYEYHRC